MVADSLSRMTMGSMSHVEEIKKDLVKDVKRFSRMGVQLEDSPNCGFMVHHNSESSLVVEVKSNKHLDKSLMFSRNQFLLILMTHSPWEGGGPCLEV